MAWYLATRGGLDRYIYRVYQFFHRVCDNLAVNHPGQVFCFTMNDLNIHKHPKVLNLITACGRRYLFRAPFWSVDSPMECIFNPIHTNLLSFLNTISNLDALKISLNIVIIGLAHVARYFFHVSFPDTECLTMVADDTIDNSPLVNSWYFSITI